MDEQKDLSDEIVMETSTLRGMATYAGTCTTRNPLDRARNMLIAFEKRLAIAKSLKRAAETRARPDGASRTSQRETGNAESAVGTDLAVRTATGRKSRRT